MNEQVSDEAVEAALEVFWANEDATYMEAMRLALETAYPYAAAAKEESLTERVALVLARSSSEEVADRLELDGHKASDPSEFMESEMVDARILARAVIAALKGVVD